MGNTGIQCQSICSQPNNSNKSQIVLEVKQSTFNTSSKKISHLSVVRQVYKSLGYNEQWLDQIKPYWISENNSLYYGLFKNKLPYGHGRLVNQDGSFFQGQFFEGSAYCKEGLFIYPDGSYYQGEIKSNKANGKGKFVYKQKTILQYNGQWLDDAPHGYGEELYIDGSRYVGEFKNGVKQGTGQFQWSNHDKYRGEFQDGLISGRGQFITFDGKYKFIGEWFRNQKNGKGRQQFEQGIVFQGNFKDNKRVGQCKFTNAQGEIKLGKYENDKFIEF